MTKLARLIQNAIYYKVSTAVWNWDYEGLLPFWQFFPLKLIWSKLQRGKLIIEIIAFLVSLIRINEIVGKWCFKIGWTASKEAWTLHKVHSFRKLLYTWAQKPLHPKHVQLLPMNVWRLLSPSVLEVTWCAAVTLLKPHQNMQFERLLHFQKGALRWALSNITFGTKMIAY